MDRSHEHVVKMVIPRRESIFIGVYLALSVIITTLPTIVFSFAFPLKSRQHDTALLSLPKLPPQLAYDEYLVEPVIDEYTERLNEQSKKVFAATLKNGWTLMPYQSKAIKQALELRRLVVAYDMGLGKTLIGCVWAEIMATVISNLQVIVICPKTLQNTWQSTICNSTTILEHSTSIFSWASVPPPTDDNTPYLVICDEAHYMQTMTAQRTKAALKLLLDNCCIGCMLLTGTPLKNGRPKHLFPLLKGVRHPMANNQQEFEEYFCNGKWRGIGSKRQVWDANGASHLVELRAHMASHVISLSKEEALEELPSFRRGPRTIEFPAEFKEPYIKAVQKLKVMLQSQHDYTTVLAASQKVRMVAAHAKVDGTVLLVDKLLSTSESAVVVFTNFVEVASRVKNGIEQLGYSCALLNGQVKNQQRQQLVEDFQAGDIQVMVSTFGTGGLGLTLTAARCVVLLDRPWTPGDVAQAEDRVRRMGQTRECIFVWMRCCEWDTQMDALLHAKQETTNAVMNSQQSSTTNPTVQQLRQMYGTQTKPIRKLSIYETVLKIAAKL